MQRRKPFSSKQRKAQLQQKRAVKRGDISPPPPSKPEHHRKGRKGPTEEASRSSIAVDSSRKLQSSFVKLPASFLEDTKELASTLPLLRPLPAERAIFNDPLSDDVAIAEEEQLTCPKRPKWRYDMTKNEVEKNEEGLFKKWLHQTDEIVGRWCDAPGAPAEVPPREDQPENPNLQMPRAPTSFERNLEVWRQLWRVTEISQILLVLLDSRCPLVHYPPSLASYLSLPHIATRTRTILVLTKVDIAGPARAAAWTDFLKARYPGLRIVQVESYVQKHAGATGKRKMYEPHLPSEFRQTLVDALKETHAELLEPPERLRAFPERVKNWKPPVKKEVDWAAVLEARDSRAGSIVGGAAAPRSRGPEEQNQGYKEEYDGEGSEQGTDPEFLTIGLIGQPNVGKSSLLNALFGVPKVKASRTPGKTKHFQTLFWTPEVRLVDCPGLVMPNFTPMGTQVLSGILPISRVSAVPLCIHHASQLLPLERIYALSHPSLQSPPPADKRTWREPRKKQEPESELEHDGKGPDATATWTAMDVLTAYALKNGWVTAKAGRPDVYRAGNAILRALAEGRIRWAFWPPGTPNETIEVHQESGTGIWIPHPTADGEEYEIEMDSDAESVEDRREASEDNESEGEEHDSQDEEVSPQREVAATGSRFGALALDDIEVEDSGSNEDS